MLSRICYAINACWQYRQELQKYLANPNLRLSAISQFKINNPALNGIKALALDFDGVLAAHAEPIPRPEAIAWLRDFEQQFAPRPIYILSNKPTVERQEYFAANFPNLRFVKGVRKKPFPDGLQQILQETKIAPAQLLLLDDRLATGVVAALSLGVAALWVSHPYTNFAVRPIRESFFLVMRTIERVYCKLIR